MRILASPRTHARARAGIIIPVFPSILHKKENLNKLE